MPEEITLYESKWLGLYRIGHWDFARRPNSDACVGILAITDGGEVVLVEQFRIPVGRKVVELPAGLVGDEPEFRSESLAETAARELMEETGYRAGRIELVLTAPTSPGMTPEFTNLFHATELSRETEGGGNASEDITVHHVPLAELRGFLADLGDDKAVGLGDEPFGVAAHDALFLARIARQQAEIEGVDIGAARPGAAQQRLLPNNVEREAAALEFDPGFGGAERIIGIGAVEIGGLVAILLADDLALGARSIDQRVLIPGRDLGNGLVFGGGIVDRRAIGDSLAAGHPAAAEHRIDRVEIYRRFRLVAGWLRHQRDGHRDRRRADNHEHLM